MKTTLWKGFFFLKENVNFMNRELMLSLFEAQREEATKRIQEGIETYRKGDCTIHLVDKQGRPVKGTLQIRQKTHAFRFGANLFMLEEFETQEKNERYKTAFKDLFNLATLPFYWSDLELEQGKPRFAKDSPKVYRRPAIDLCLEYCKANGIEPKAHCLTYVNFTPDWVNLNDIEETKRLLEERYRVLAEHCSDQIHQWEVINETLCFFHEASKSAFFQMKDLVEWNFQLAEKYFKNNELILNEATSFVLDQHPTPRSNYYMLIERALEHGARIDTIGMQYHVFTSQEDLEKQVYAINYNPSLLYKNLDLLGEFGKPLQVTEITVPAFSDQVEDEELQADILEWLYSIWFSHPQMEAIIYWNLPDGYAAFAPQGDFSRGENAYRGGLLHFDLSPKPAYNRLKDLIWNKWQTRVDGETDSEGVFSFRGFYGSYDVELKTKSGIHSYTIDLSKNQDNDLTIVVED